MYLFPFSIPPFLCISLFYFYYYVLSILSQHPPLSSYKKVSLIIFLFEKYFNLNQFLINSFLFYLSSTSSSLSASLCSQNSSSPKILLSTFIFPKPISSPSAAFLSPYSLNPHLLAPSPDRNNTITGPSRRVFRLSSPDHSFP